MRPLKFKVYYQHDETGRITSRNMVIGQPIPHLGKKWQTPVAVCQYTGLNDRERKEIYEGDIIDFTVFGCYGSDTQYKGVVVYSGSRFLIWKSEHDEYYRDDGGFDLDWILSQDSETEIIGNVKENPGLLPGKE